MNLITPKAAAKLKLKSKHRLYGPTNKPRKDVAILMLFCHELYYHRITTSRVSLINKLSYKFSVCFAYKSITLKRILDLKDNHFLSVC